MHSLSILVFLFWSHRHSPNQWGPYNDVVSHWTATVWIGCRFFTDLCWAEQWIEDEEVASGVSVIIAGGQGRSLPKTDRCSLGFPCAELVLGLNPKRRGWSANGHRPRLSSDRAQMPRCLLMTRRWTAGLRSLPAASVWGRDGISKSALRR